MKITSFFTVLLALLLVASCQDKEQLIEPLHSETTPNLSPQQVDDLKQLIVSQLKADDITISEILDIRYVANTHIVRFMGNEQPMEMGFGSLFEDDGTTISANINYTVYCSWNCDCGLQGSGNSYLQCKCNRCQMHIRIQDKSGTPYNIQQMATESFVKTFGQQPDQLRLSKFRPVKHDIADVYTIFYMDEHQAESSFMLIANNQYEQLTFQGQKSRKNIKKFIVDCTGSCDCRERFFPANQSVECTCSPCQMQVTNG